ncbi:MAG: tetratricopeptide repeat protein [Prevotella sp.]|jgi:uncharacterized membrane protein YeiB
MIRYRIQIGNIPVWRIFLLLYLLLSMPFASFAVTKQEADAAYKKGDYQQAIVDYRNILKHQRSADVYYNLGNAYYRSDSITMAILAYERALLLSPGDNDIRYNLQFARSKTIDKLAPESEVVFNTWYRSVVNFTSANIWAVVSVVSIIFALILMLVYLFVPKLVWRKVGFFGASLFIIVFGFSTLFAWSQHNAMTNRNGAIIIVPSVKVKKTPVKNGEDAFILHEGTRVEVTDNTLPQWKGVRLSDGREGWIPASRLEMI